MVKSDKTLEIQGLLSPHAETIARETLSALVPGQVLTIVTRDGAACEKLSPLCTLLGCAVIDTKEERGTIYVQIRR